VWTNLSVGCVRRSDGTVDYVLALVEDITDRKETEESCEGNNNGFGNLVEND